MAAAPRPAGRIAAAPKAALPAAFKGFPPLRPSPFEVDDKDGQRAKWAWKYWNGQTVALRMRDRVIEENIRVLAGQQWTTWNNRAQRFVDVTHWFTEEEKRYRQRPVFNRLLPWFILTHARLVENPPICTFVPGPDRIDAELAETMDDLYKALWRDVGMVDANDRLWAWVIASGSAYMQSRIDLTRGDQVPWRGPATLPMQLDQHRPPILDAQGDPISEQFDNVPFNEQGEPQAFYHPDHGMVETGEPYQEREGELDVDVFSPFEVRGEWGPTPWQKKRWHASVSYLTPEAAYNAYKVELEPDIIGASAEHAGEMERILFGSGFFGAATQKQGSIGSGPQTGNDEYCRVLTFWHAPTDAVPEMAQTKESAGGRLMICTPEKVLYDGVRPRPFRYTSPIRRFDFIRLPGRPSGTTPLEMMVGPQRAYNKGWGQILEHRGLVTNPIALVDSTSGLQNITITNQPGKKYKVTARPGVKPMEWLVPPPLGGDVYRSQEMLLDELTDMGNLKGTEGVPSAPDASGEQIKELRFNSDRFLGPTVRRAVEEYARMIEDWMVLLPVLWPRDKVLSYAGDDNVARTISVYPQLLEGGKVNVVPDVESMLPEGRGERQAKVYQMYKDGMFGPPGTPPAVKQYLELARFPHLGRAVRPGGPNRSTAEQHLGRLMQGQPAASLPWYPWYDPTTHLDVLVNFMSSPEFEKQAQPIQWEMGMRWERIMAMQQQAMMAMAPQIPGQPGGPGGPPAPGQPGGTAATAGGVTGEDRPSSGLFLSPADAHSPKSASGAPMPSSMSV